MDLEVGMGMTRTALIATLAVLATASATAQEEAGPKPGQREVIAVLAHPDDELPMAPALAALAREGAYVRIVYATDGDAGPGVSDYQPGEQLGIARQLEAFCAGKALGASMVTSFNRGDGRLGVDAHHKAGSARKLKGDLESYVPGNALVLTWGPDGGYGHADHRMVSALTTQVVQAIPAATRPKLLYVGIPNGSLPPVPEMSDWATTDPALLTETVAYTPADLEAAKAAAQCHVTQFDEATRAGMMPLFDATMWRGKVHFRPAF
jgi:LmbE family N-acetylglucosaminyl deacetylase